MESLVLNTCRGTLGTGNFGLWYFMPFHLEFCIWSNFSLGFWFKKFASKQHHHMWWIWTVAWVVRLRVLFVVHSFVPLPPQKSSFHFVFKIQWSCTVGLDFVILGLELFGLHIEPQIKLSNYFYELSHELLGNSFNCCNCVFWSHRFYIWSITR